MSAECCTDSALPIAESLQRLGIVPRGESVQMTPLSGGVSSDIWRVDLPSGSVCVKRALPRLRVDALWEAPVARNHYEWLWMKTVSKILPGAVPGLIAEDALAGFFVMEFLDPAKFPVWKSQLRSGCAETATAAAVGAALAAIHAATAGRPDIAAMFRTDTIFEDIRIQPYLIEAARKNPDVSPALHDIAAQTRSNRKVLVHGDVSPKNVLIGPAGPVFLDAECAWYGDPAFDIAFCLNHLLLKCLWVPPAQDRFLKCFEALSRNYIAGVTWENREKLEGRTARLLAGLLLARIDGKSPVEYITDEAQKDRVRNVATELLIRPVDRLSNVEAAFQSEFSHE